MKDNSLCECGCGGITKEYGGRTCRFLQGHYHRWKRNQTGGAWGKKFQRQKSIGRLRAHLIRLIAFNPLDVRSIVNELGDEWPHITECSVSIMLSRNCERVFKKAGRLWYTTNSPFYWKNRFGLVSRRPSEKTVRAVAEIACKQQRSELRNDLLGIAYEAAMDSWVSGGGLDAMRVAANLAVKRHFTAQKQYGHTSIDYLIENGWEPEANQ